MTAYPAGQILCGDNGCMHVRIWEERYYISPEDLGRLFFVGDRVPLKKKGPTRQPSMVSGSVSLHPSGQAIVIAAGTQRYLLPRDRFFAVALGEEISSVFFEVPGDAPEIELNSPHKGDVPS
jgi:hypothetical protein